MSAHTAPDVEANESKTRSHDPEPEIDVPGVHPWSQLTVLTMNCLGLPVPVPGLRTRLLSLGGALATAGADIACLQEVGRWRYLALLRHPDGPWAHTVAMTHPYAPKGGLVTLSRLAVQDVAFRPFAERGGFASLHAAERYQGKGVLGTWLRVDGRELVVLNTHLSANYTARWSYKNPYARVERAQLREIAQWVQAVSDETIVVVAGDFNVPRGSWLYDEFRSGLDLLDPLADATEPTYRPLPGLPPRALQALDHIFVRAPRDLAVTAESELCFRDPVLLAHGAPGFLSDHLGVRLTLRWRAEP